MSIISDSVNVSCEKHANVKALMETLSPGNVRSYYTKGDVLMHVTMSLRWYAIWDGGRVGQPVLQQKWIGSDGSEAWHSVVSVTGEP